MFTTFPKVLHIFFVLPGTNSNVSTTSVRNLRKQQKCCDPFSYHKMPVTKGLRTMTENMKTRCQSLSVMLEGDQLCTKCRKQGTVLPILSVSSDSEPNSGEIEMSD